KPLGNGLSRRRSEGLRARVDLDAGQDAVAFKLFGKWHAARRFLVDGFVIHDSAANEVGGARRSKEHFPVSATALFSRRNAENIKSFRQSRGCFVGRKYPLPAGNQTRGKALKIIAHDADPRRLHSYVRTVQTIDQPPDRKF